MTDAVLIIDTSYIVFAKYYAALNWYKTYVDRNPDIPTIVHNSTFTAKYSANFERCVARVCARFGVQGGNVVFAKDCSKSSVWRRQLFDAYKASRMHNGLFNREIFAFTYGTLVPSLIRAHGGAVVGTETAEADDVIAIVHRHVRDKLRRLAVILSNDNDSIQLLDAGTRITNLMNCDVGGRRGALTPEQYLLCRIISGDRSDNIPSVFPYCGMKTAARMVTQSTREQLDALVAARPGAAADFERNDRLMNMAMIPDDIRARVVALIEAAMPSPAAVPAEEEPPNM